MLLYGRKKTRSGEVKQRHNKLGLEEGRPHQECYGQKTLKTKVHSRSDDQFRKCFKRLQKPEILHKMRILSHFGSLIQTTKTLILVLSLVTKYL